jgi:quercetin dioxygenase-like cupin family protein
MTSTQKKHEEMDPMKVASNVTGLLIENDRVRVLRAKWKVGEKAAMHSHPDHVMYVVKGGRIKLTQPSGKADTMDLETGKAIFMKAQTHEVTNVGKTDVEMIVTELK